MLKKESLFRGNEVSGSGAVVCFFALVKQNSAVAS
jgi:hypothetical protein